MATVAEQLVRALREAGVERIYGIVGDSLNPVVDAVRRTDGIEWVHVRHEEAAAFAAAAEAQVTGKLAVCAGSCGPGNLHLINGLYDAHRSGAPVLAIASHIPSTQIGTGFFQETHPAELFRECSHYSELVADAGAAAAAAGDRDADRGRQAGVSVLSIPGDVADREAVGERARCRWCRRPRWCRRRRWSTNLASLLNSADKVMLFAGAGVAGAHGEVMSLAAALAAPVGHSLGGKEWIQYDNPYDVGMSGLLGYGACYEAMHEADLVVLLGTDFPYDNFLPGARTVQIDIEPAHLGRRTPLVLGVHGSVRETVQAVLPLLRSRPDRSYLDRMLRRHARKLEQVVEAYTSGVSQRTPDPPGVRGVDRGRGSRVRCGVHRGHGHGQRVGGAVPDPQRPTAGPWLVPPRQHGERLAPGDRRRAGFAGPPGGVAVRGRRPVMLMGELLTLSAFDVPVKVVVFNNASLGMVKLEMLVDGLPDYGTDHPPVDFAAIAAACGIYSTRVTDPGSIRGALEKAFAHPGPAVVELVTDPNALSIPPKITGEMVRGFALAASKTVLNGGVGKMIELARSNLRNAPRP